MRAREVLRRWRAAAARKPIDAGGTRPATRTSDEKRRRVVELTQLARDRVERGEAPRSPATPESEARRLRVNVLVEKVAALLARNRTWFDASGDCRAPTGPVEIG